MEKYVTNILNRLNCREVNQRSCPLLGYPTWTLSTGRIMPGPLLQQSKVSLPSIYQSIKWKPLHRRPGSPPSTRPGVESMLADGAILTDMGKFIPSEVSQVSIKYGV
jgi:hypothetical protein